MKGEAFISLLTIMKRSEINQVIIDMEMLVLKCGFHLPPFADWTVEEWKEKNSEYDEIRENKLGWDITDFGLGNFRKWGFGLFTIRNGNHAMPDKYPKTYAEKLLCMYPGQKAQIHYHKSKMEDIINRGGNDVTIKLWNGSEDLQLLDTDVEVCTDGRRRMRPAGTEITLHPGESITIQPYQFHDFIMPESGEMTLIGEVSMCNDDDNDNFWYNRKVGRFPEIEEDERPYRLLCNEYDKWR